MEDYQENTLKNEKHYDEVYRKVNIQRIVDIVNRVDDFLDDATRTDTSWVGLYHGGFKNRLKGKKVLELGCGDCTNLAVMAALGAEVSGNDISQQSGHIIRKLNVKCDFPFPIQFVKGDFLETEIIPDSYDVVIGKAFVHHLTNEQEVAFTEKIVKALKPNGIVRYFEPAVNSEFLDQLRWLSPVPGRPSKLQRKKFQEWKLNDPHPDRDNSSKHYREIGVKYFENSLIVPLGAIERFCRFIPAKYNRPFRRLAFKVERLIPKSLSLILTRSHMIEYSNPKKT